MSMSECGDRRRRGAWRAQRVRVSRCGYNRSQPHSIVPSHLTTVHTDRTPHTERKKFTRPNGEPNRTEPPTRATIRASARRARTSWLSCANTHTLALRSARAASSAVLLGVHPARSAGHRMRALSPPDESDRRTKSSPCFPCASRVASRMPRLPADGAVLINHKSSSEALALLHAVLPVAAVLNEW